MRYHNLAVDTAVSFEGSSDVYYTTYNELLTCDSKCTEDHDCFEEPHIVVEKRITTSFPISRLKHVFDQPNHMGRLATRFDKGE
jgi:hypothetical protein